MIVITIMVLLLSGCTTTKQVHQERVIEETQAKATEERLTSSASETKIETKATAETDIKETFDTVVHIWPVVGGKIADEPVDIVIKGERTIHRKEDTNQQHQNKELGNTTVNRKEQVNQKSDALLKDKNIQRTALPWWAIALFILAVVISVGVFIWRFIRR